MINRYLSLQIESLDDIYFFLADKETNFSLRKIQYLLKDCVNPSSAGKVKVKKKRHLMSFPLFKTNVRVLHCLPSIILDDVLRNRSFLQRVQKVTVCDWWISTRFVFHVLFVIVIMIDGSEKRNSKVPSSRVVEKLA